jgi:hypothetical protein
MIRVVRRVQLLTVLVLLLTGLLQSLASAQGVTCTRSHAPADAERQVHGSSIVDGRPADAGAPLAAADTDHHHSHAPQPADARAPSAPCGTAIVPAERSTPSLHAVARPLLPWDDQVPARLLTGPLFRPPRLS